MCTLVTLASGCGQHYVARGADLYDNGRYIEAAEVFERTEARLSESSPAEQARFGLYRGATFLKLGDAVHAARWLGYARSVINQNPDALEANEVTLLDTSLRRLATTSTPPAPQPQAAMAAAPASPRGAAAQ